MYVQEESWAQAQLRLVRAEANTDWLIKFDGRLEGRKADL